MPLVVGKSFLNVTARWLYRRLATGFASSDQKGELSFKLTPDATVFTHALGVQYTIAAAGTQVLDFYTFTAMSGEVVAAITKLKAVLITAASIATPAVTGGVLKIEPDATNALVWPFAGTTPSVSLAVGTDGACLLLSSGTTVVVSATVRRWLLTNTGSVSINVNVLAYLGA